MYFFICVYKEKEAMDFGGREVFGRDWREEAAGK